MSSDTQASERAKILIVDDDPPVLEMLEDLFTGDYIILLADSGAKAIAIAEEHSDLCAVVMDIKMAPMDGIHAARRIRTVRPDARVIFHTGYPGDYVETMIDSDERPYDYIEKGGSIPRLIRSVRNAVEAHGLKESNEDLFEIAERNFGLVGRSPLMRDVFHTIRKISPTNSKVMILGETGTGKELVARAIHNFSKRRAKRLGILNCNHKNPDLVESELFGHVRGAFTSAAADRIGLFEYAEGGTVFLDEIGDLDMTTQAKLLRVLETREYTKIGTPNPQLSDIRILCATHRDLMDLVKKGTFREDLYYRLKGVIIQLPPLRERVEDIPRLVEKFAADFAGKEDTSTKIFDNDAINLLLHYDWPGNVRQLQDVVYSVMVLTESDIIVADDIQQALGAVTASASSTLSLPERLKSLERILIVEALTGTGGNIAAAARLLGVDRTTLQKKLRTHRLDADSLRR